jgi:hypothetical protein
MIVGYCGTCESWAPNRSGMQWHCATEKWCCDACYARESGVALWFWA